jgi:hypothetical protein
MATPLIEAIALARSHRSAPKFRKCLDMISDSLRRLTSSLWHRLVVRISLPVSLTVSSDGLRTQPNAKNTFTCPLMDRQPVDGIIAYLTKAFGGNVHDIGTVAITASRAQVIAPVKNLANLDSPLCFATREEKPEQ